MDLQQHVTSPTHQDGGTLDLVITFIDWLQGWGAASRSTRCCVRSQSDNMRRVSPPIVSAVICSTSSQLAWRWQGYTASTHRRQFARLCAAVYSQRRWAVSDIWQHATQHHRPTRTGADCQVSTATAVSVVWCRVQGYPSQLSLSWTSLQTDTRSGWQGCLCRRQPWEAQYYPPEKEEILIGAHSDRRQFTDEALEVADSIVAARKTNG